MKKISCLIILILIALPIKIIGGYFLYNGIEHHSSSGATVYTSLQAENAKEPVIDMDCSYDHCSSPHLLNSCHPEAVLFSPNKALLLLVSQHTDIALPPLLRPPITLYN